MYRGLRVAVVVPAHNEERLIGRTVSTMPDFVDHIIVVDDASSDGTAEAAKAVGDSRAQVITLIENQGVGGAILTGHAEALVLDADVSVVMAGDAQMDPDYLPALLDPIASGEAQFTKGNRFYGKGSFAGMPRHRILGNLALSFLTKAASGYWNLFDPLNGYTAISREALLRLDLSQIERRYEFENDLLIHLNIQRVRAVDVAIPAQYGDEVSGINLRKQAPRAVRHLARGFWSRIWWKYVLQSFSAVALMLFGGLVLTGVGLAISLWTAVHTLGPATASAGTVVLAVAPLLSGFHMLIYAMVLDIQDNTAR
ncbi:Glycosyltransferase involved in cell wall bisynthesis [Pedococcus cremeus]|uniref:Glycosyltransferase involved in cell wall bisynthesis n=1 Tax=Pedococcus cremeus TaxID=587636 RepID=A0A1H9XBU1_9MICO|nr:glycosyltransferase family 2 protein [Pedococcus cremeus]SES43595.1 Glycosyltransferase involved in cell wall bisynthesis [Pedococcus cremeus]